LLQWVQTQPTSFPSLSGITGLSNVWHYSCKNPL